MNNMKNYIKHIATAAVMLFMALNLSAQNEYYEYGAPRAPRQRLINWTPPTTEGQRWTVALRPFYLAQHGLRVDFEFELARPGDWVRVELAYHKRRTFESRYRNNYPYGSEYNGWSGLTSDWDEYTKMNGAGIGVGFKSMWSPGGWYFNAQATFNLYNVWYKDHIYRESVNEDGLNIWTRNLENQRARFYKPEVSFNIGKHFALGRRVFIDGFTGFGYAWSFGDGWDSGKFTGNPYAFGGEGLFFNMGFRIGVLLGK